MFVCECISIFCKWLQLVCLACLNVAPNFTWHQPECGEMVISLQASCYWLKPATTGTSPHSLHTHTHLPIPTPSPSSYPIKKVLPLSLQFLLHPLRCFTPLLSSHIPCATDPRSPTLFLPLSTFLFNPSDLTSSPSFSLDRPPFPPSFLLPFPPLGCSGPLLRSSAMQIRSGNTRVSLMLSWIFHMFTNIPREAAKRCFEQCLLPGWPPVRNGPSAFDFLSLWTTLGSMSVQCVMMSQAKVNGTRMEGAIGRVSSGALKER